MYPIMFIEICFNKHYRVCVLIYFLIKVFHFIITFFKNQSDMCEIKTVIIVAALLIPATNFCIYPVIPKVGHHSEIKGESPCEKEYKEYCLNGGECYYLDDEDIVGSSCTWLYGGKRWENNMWWD